MPATDQRKLSRKCWGALQYARTFTSEADFDGRDGNRVLSGTSQPVQAQRTKGARHAYS